MRFVLVSDQSRIGTARPTVADRTHYKWVPRRIGGGTAVRPVPDVVARLWAKGVTG